MSDAGLPAVADIVVIGGGAVGTSTAFHLCEAGAGTVVLVERGELACGSTSKAAGGFRTQFSDPLNIAISQRSAAALRRFTARPGWEIDLHEVGYLFVLTTPEEVAAFEASTALQRSMGSPNEMLTPRQAQQLVPPLKVDDALAASWSPRDGTATPEALVQGYATGARRHGGVVRTHCAVTSIDTSAGEVSCVHTSLGSIRTGAVVCAAGPWSRQIGDLVGVDLPVDPLGREVVLTDSAAGMARNVPLTIDLATGYYFHGEGRGLIMGIPTPGVGIGFGAPHSDEYLPAMHEVIERRIPALLGVGLRGGWWGLHEMTPDHNALIGQARDPKGFFYATGFSGHGFQQSPAVGEIMRDLVLGRTPMFDVTSLHAERFASGLSRPENHVI